AAGVVVNGSVEVGQVGALEGCEFAQLIGRRTRRSPSLDELRDHLLAFANQKQIDEIGDRFGIEKNGGATGDDQREIAARAVGATSRYPGHPQHGQDIEIVGLEGNRKREDVEIREGTAALEGDKRLAAAG